MSEDGGLRFVFVNANFHRAKGLCFFDSHNENAYYSSGILRVSQ